MQFHYETNGPEKNALLGEVTYSDFSVVLTFHDHLFHWILCHFFSKMFFEHIFSIYPFRSDFILSSAMRNL